MQERNEALIPQRLRTNPIKKCKSILVITIMVNLYWMKLLCAIKHVSPEGALYVIDYGLKFLKRKDRQTDR